MLALDALVGTASSLETGAMLQAGHQCSCLHLNDAGRQCENVAPNEGTLAGQGQKIRA